MTHKEWLKTVTSDSQRAVARALGIDHAQINRELTRGLDADRVIQIAYAYNLDPVRALQDTGHLRLHTAGTTIDTLLDQVLHLAEEAKRMAESEEDSPDVKEAA